MGAAERMLQVILDEFRRTERFTGRSAPDPRVLEALARVSREEFVAPGFRDTAYVDSALPIACGQTISQPFIVALMTDLLDVKPEHRVLDVGTGSGYQAAVLAELCETVCTIEIHERLAREAAERLRRLGYDNIEFRTGDAWHGWSERAPFDRVLVAAVAPRVPEALLEQLAPTGRLVMPVERAWSGQTLVVVDKDAGSKIDKRRILPVRFVPLAGGPARR